MTVLQVHEALQLLYKNSNELNRVIDEKLPGRPAFQRHEVIVAGEAFELFSRDIIKCIEALWGDVDFAEHLVVEPERHYADVDQTIRLYFDMHTGKWWWCTQVGFLEIPLMHGKLLIYRFRRNLKQKQGRKGVLSSLSSYHQTKLNSPCFEANQPILFT